MSQPVVFLRLALVLSAAALGAACASDPVQPVEPVEPVAHAEPARSDAGPAAPAVPPAVPPAAPVGEPLVYRIPLETLAGEPTSLAEHRGKALLIVNVASECGLTPQYKGLEELQETYGPRGFEVIGFPCNQFGGQEPGDAEQIRGFCTQTYGVTFPLMEKIEVNGPGRHPLYRELVLVPDQSGAAGDVQWNFEKFVVSADGKRIVRFRPRTEPGSLEVVAAIEAALP